MNDKDSLEFFTYRKKHLQIQIRSLKKDLDNARIELKNVSNYVRQLKLRIKGGAK